MIIGDFVTQRDQCIFQRCVCLCGSLGSKAPEGGVSDLFMHVILFPRFGETGGRCCLEVVVPSTPKTTGYGGRA